MEIRKDPGHALKRYYTCDFWNKILFQILEYLTNKKNKEIEYDRKIKEKTGKRKKGK